jgi:SAM-dependent methyltransferase
MDLRESYDSAAEAYAEHLATELVHKPLDRHLLNRFAEAVAGRGLVADLGCGPGHAALQAADLAVIEHTEREPYEGAEYPSRRCYLLASAACTASAAFTRGQE